MGRIVSNAGLSPAIFDLELTESSMLADPDAAVTTMKQLVGAGFTMSIDDFGTGYSSLAYLKRFSAHHLKIDISFVRDKIGRASCRERVCQYVSISVVAGSLKKKRKNI